LSSLPSITVNDIVASHDQELEDGAEIFWLMHKSGLKSEEYLNIHYPEKPGEGLPRWTGANRTIEDRDIVIWYTLGVTHIPRTEDWPIMPVHPTGFRLVPAGFFSQNPGGGLAL
jgi:Cu2+-containing amine oxidase